MSTLTASKIKASVVICSAEDSIVWLRELGFDRDGKPLPVE